MFNELSLSMLAAKGPTFFMPPQSSTVAPQVDRVFDLVFWISLFFFVLVVGVMIYFIIKYRHRPGHVESKTSSHNDILEVTWSVIPALLTVLIFVEGVNSYLNLRQPPPDCYEIDVVAKKWNWTFIYPNGVATDELHFPVGRPVKLVMTSDDVLHSFFIPDFRVKMDLIKGRYTYLWFQVDEPSTERNEKGELIGHRIYCTEYCGTQHSTMKTWAFADTPEDFDAWLAKEADYVNDRERFPTLADAGEEVYRRRGCSQCHSTEPDKTLTGPSFYGTYGTEQITSAGPIIVDANYVRESILQPNAKVRQGFKSPSQMPSFQGLVKDDEIAALIAFMKRLNPAYTGDDAAPESSEGSGEADAGAEETPPPTRPDDPTTTTEDTPSPVRGETANPEPASSDEPGSEEAAPEGPSPSSDEPGEGENPPEDSTTPEP